MSSAFLSYRCYNLVISKRKAFFPPLNIFFSNTSIVPFVFCNPLPIAQDRKTTSSQIIPLLPSPQPSHGQSQLFLALIMLQHPNIPPANALDMGATIFNVYVTTASSPISLQPLSHWSQNDLSHNTNLITSLPYINPIHDSSLSPGYSSDFLTDIRLYEMGSAMYIHNYLWYNEKNLSPRIFFLAS